MAAKQKKNVPTPTPKSKPEPRKATLPPMTTAFESGFWSAHVIPAAIIMLLAFVLYGASIRFGYILDDELVIQKNAYVQRGFSGIKDIFAHDSFMGYFQKKDKLYLLEGGRYRPMSLATFAAEVGVLGKDSGFLPKFSHFINILLYGLTGIVLYRILLGLFAVRNAAPVRSKLFSLPFLAAVIFILHPLHTECIANIKGRDEILALLFSLLALYANIRYFDSLKSKWLVFSGVFMLFGLFSKENTLTFLAVIPLTTWFFLHVPVRRAINASLPLLGAAVLFILMRYQALGFMLDHGKAITDVMNMPFLGMSFADKTATIFLTLGWYVKLLFYPHPLTHDYYPYHVPKVGWSDWRAIVSLIGYLVAGVWAVLNLRKRNLLAWCVLFFLLTMSIVSNLFVSVGTFMNERFAFMPSVAFCVAIAWLIARYLPSLFKEKQDAFSIIGLGLMAVLAGFFGWITMTRVPVWDSESALNESAIKISEGSARAHLFYVTSLYKKDYSLAKTKEEKQPIVDKMEYHIKRCLEINPTYGSAFQMAAGVAAARFDLDKQLDKLLNEFEFIVRKIPYNNDFRSFLDQYMKYLDGSNADKYIPFTYRVGYEFFYKEKKDVASAIKFLNYGLAREYEDIRILNGLAEVYQAAGDNAKAAEMKARADAQRKLYPGLN